MIYNFSELTNNTSQSLDIGWTKTFHPKFPVEWTSTVEVPDSFYNDNAIDSGVFILKVNPGFENKTILQIYPNGVAGQSSAYLKLWDINNPSDSIAVRYSILIENMTTAINGQELESGVEIGPNPVHDRLIINADKALARGEIFDVSGKMLNTFNMEKMGGDSFELNLQFLPKGQYLLKLEDKEGGQPISFPFLKE